MPYHSGELTIQTQAGVQALAERIGRSIHMTMPYIAQQFLEAQSFAIASSVDSNGHVWASILTGEPGFMQAIDDQTVQLNLRIQPHDPLSANLQTNPQIGLLLIDLATRQRMRINGTVVRTPAGFMLVTEQVYSNCQKYIQKRTASPASRGMVTTHQSETLSEHHQTCLSQADTFFIASYHPDGGADASHRGGNPGFVRVLSSQKLEFPDYAGNMMFNTLGNIAENPSTGLLFIDFTAGNLLQLTGQAKIIWDTARLASFPQAERIVEFKIDHLIETQNALSTTFSLEQFSPHNPPA